MSEGEKGENKMGPKFSLYKVVQIAKFLPVYNIGERGVNEQTNKSTNLFCCDIPSCCRRYITYIIIAS